MKNRYHPGRSASAWAVYDRKTGDVVMVNTREQARLLAHDLNKAEKENAQTDTSNAA